MKICFIGGCGHVSQAYTEMKDHPEAEFVGAAPGSEHETDYHPAAPGIPLFEDYRRMLDETAPDVAVLSPVYGLTGVIAIECAKRGIHVFAEKPLASTLEELETLEKIAAEKNVRLCAMHYLRFTPAFYQAEKLVKSGAIGDVKMVTAQKSYRFGIRPPWYWDKKLYPGIVPWVGIHAIECIYHLTGKAFRTVSTVEVGEPPRNAAVCQFTMEDGVTASVNMDFLRPEAAPSHEDDRIRAIGTEGVIEVREQRVFLINADGYREITPEQPPRLGLDFLYGRPESTNEDILAVTRAALTAQLAAATSSRREIG